MLREEDVIREMEFYSADTEELWEGKFAEEVQREIYDTPENREAAKKIVGIIGISPKAGASFIAEALMREVLWRENDFADFPEKSSDKIREETLRSLKIVDLGETKVDLRSLDFLIVVEDGRGFSLAEENHRERMSACLKRLGIPFQLVVNRGCPSGEAKTLPIFFPVMDFRPAEKLLEILESHFSEKKKASIH